MTSGCVTVRDSLWRNLIHILMAAKGGMPDNSLTFIASTMMLLEAQETETPPFLLRSESLHEPESDSFDLQSSFWKSPTILTSVDLGKALSMPLVPYPQFQIIDMPSHSNKSTVHALSKELICPFLKKPDMDSDDAVMRSSSDNIYSQTEAAYRPLGLGFSKKFHQISILPMSKSHSGCWTVFEELQIVPLQALVNLEKVLSTPFVYPLSLVTAKSQCSYVPSAPSKEHHGILSLFMLKREARHRTAKIKYPIQCLDFAHFVFMVNWVIISCSN